MRNGNVRSVHTLPFLISLRSYPTYEEWKPGTKTGSRNGSITSSYSTYEEWKRIRTYM